MQDLIKRYFWVLGAAVVMVCSVFAAKATSHILEAKFRGDSDHAPRVIPVMQAPVAVKQTRSKDGAGLVTRDIFCSECTPAVSVASTNPNDIQTTTLPLVLLATNVAPKPEDSYATIINTENQRQGSFGVGDAIPGATGKLKEIHYKYVDFENSGHIERLVLAGQVAPVAAPVAQATSCRPRSIAASRRSTTARTRSTRVSSRRSSRTRWASRRARASCRQCRTASRTASSCMRSGRAACTRS